MIYENLLLEFSKIVRNQAKLVKILESDLSVSKLLSLNGRDLIWLHNLYTYKNAIGASGASIEHLTNRFTVPRQVGKSKTLVELYHALRDLDVSVQFLTYSQSRAKEISQKNNIDTRPIKSKFSLSCDVYIFDEVDYTSFEEARNKIFNNNRNKLVCFVGLSTL